MSNEEKLREALGRLLEASTIATPKDREGAERCAWLNAEAVLRDTAPPKHKHPAEVAWEEKTPESERSAWNRNTFLSGYKAGIESIAILALSQHAEIINLNFIQKLADEVPIS